MYRKILFIVLAGLLFSACSRNVKVTEKELEKKFKEFAQNNPKVNAEGNITFEYLYSYPNDEFEEYGQPLKNRYLDKMSNREVSLVADLIWAARRRQERGKLWIQAQNQTNQELMLQMAECFGGDLGSNSRMELAQIERVINKLRLSLDKKMKEKNIETLSVYEVRGDSGYKASAVVSNKGIVGFFILQDNEDEIRDVVSTSLNKQTDNISIEVISSILMELLSQSKETYDICQNTARSFLNFALSNANLMFLNGEAILETEHDIQIDPKALIDSLSASPGLDRYLYEWRDSIFSADNGFTIKTNGFNWEGDKLVGTLEILKTEDK